MRVLQTLLVVSAIAASTSSAFAQDSVSIPYAPPPGAAFEVSEVHSEFSGAGVLPVSTYTARYSLEFQSMAAPYQVRWTTLAFDANGADGVDHPEPALLLGLPVSLQLDETGIPVDVVDWDALQEVLRQRFTKDESSRGSSLLLTDGLSPRSAAMLLATPLTIVGACHGVDLVVGEADVSSRETQAGDVRVRSTTSRLLERVDRETGVARVTFVFTSEYAVPDDFEVDIGQPQIRVRCDIDLVTGIVRAASVEVFDDDEQILTTQIEIVLRQ